MATLYLLHGYLKVARKFITGSTAEQRPGWVGGEVLLKYPGGCERLCWKTSKRIFFSAVKPNYRNAHRQLRSLVCVSQQWVSQPNHTNEKLFRFARQRVHNSNKSAIDQTYYYTDDNWGKTCLSGPKGHLRSMSQVWHHYCRSNGFGNVWSIYCPSQVFLDDEKKKNLMMKWFMGDTHQFFWKLHSRGDG